MRTASFHQKRLGMAKKRAYRGPRRHKLETIEHYNAIAEAYDSLYGQEQEMKIDFMLGRLSLEGMRTILDAGCGTCLLFENIYDDDRILVGVDTSEKILREGWRKFRDKANTLLVQADAEHLPFRGKAFDAVFAVTLIQNLPKPRRFLEEAKRVSKEGATIVVSGLKRKYTFERFNSMLKKTILLKESYDVEGLKDYIAFGSA